MMAAMMKVSSPSSVTRICRTRQITAVKAALADNCKSLTHHEQAFHKSLKQVHISLNNLAKAVSVILTALHLQANISHLETGCRSCTRTLSELQNTVNKPDEKKR